MNSRLCTLLIVFFLTTSTAHPDDAVEKKIRGLAQPMIDRKQSVGLVVGVVHGGKHEVFGFGRPSLEASAPPNGKTIFEIGSITKVFTSIALADLVREKKVALDDPVVFLLPGGVTVPEKNGKVISLRMLATHRSGLGRIIPKVLANEIVGKQPYEDVSTKDVYDFLSTAKLNHEPGTRFGYSNLGAGLLGLALARREQTSYEELVVERICKPLELRDTLINIDASNKIRLAKPYNSQGKPALAWKFDSFAGAGALRSTADDMMHFIDANLGTVSIPETIRASLDLALKPRTDTDTQDRKIALGWMIDEPDAKAKLPEVTWHNGGTGGFSSYLGMLRGKNCGVVVLSNSNARVDAIGLAVLEQLARE